MKMKKAVAVLAAGAMVMGTLASCGSTDNGASSASGGASNGASTEKGSGENGGASQYQTTYGSKQFDNVTINVELFDRSSAPSGSTITDNKWVEYVNQEMNKVGITVNFVTVPRSDEVQKMQTMMSSGTAPDITITYTYAYAQDYYDQGGIWDLSEFIDGEDQAQNMKKYLGKDVIDIGRNGDGNLYGIVAKRATTADSNLFIRKDWLDDLGLDVPTTPDELYNVVDQMVHNNPDGITNVVGCTPWGLNNGSGIRNTLSLAFSELAGDEKERDIAGGIDYYYDPGCREYFRFVNKMYNAGLIDPEFYTQTDDTFNSDIVTGVEAFFESNVNYSVDVLRGSLLKTLQENDPNADIISIAPLKNVNDGVQYCMTYAPGGLVCFCPKTASAEVVEACMTYLDWQCTEAGGFVIYHGFEGEHYEMEDGVPVVKDSVYNATDKDWIRTDLFLAGNQGYFDNVDAFNACTSKEAPGYEQYVIDNYENSLTGTLVPNPTYTSPSESELKADLDLVRNEYVIKVASCPEAEFDALYDEFMKACEDAGIQKVVDERTAYYNELYK